MRRRKLSRRSFLGKVIGNSVVGAGALIAFSAEANAIQSDRDSGSNADPPGGGRTGVTDADRRDRANYGRSGRPRRVTDQDSSDSVNRGRGPRRCSDGDRGRSGDPANRGRRC